MPERATTDHGEIIHWAGHRGLFPVRKRGEPASIRLAPSSAPDEERIGWDAFFDVVNHARLALVYDDAPGATASRLVPARSVRRGAGAPSL